MDLLVAYSNRSDLREQLQHVTMILPEEAELDFDTPLRSNDPLKRRADTGAEITVTRRGNMVLAYSNPY